MSPSEPDRRRKILFFAEAVTLAHIARPITLARGLDPARYAVTLATAPRYESLWRDPPIAVQPIESIPCARFLDALARGQPVYDAETLRQYVRDDLAAIDEVQPDVIVGDFRLSLSISARLARLPYLAITNAYWSPYARQRFPLPELPVVGILGLPLAKVAFRMVQPIAFALHTRLLNRVRREHGLPSLGTDLRRVYTDADQTLYADVPDLVPTFNLPANHHYLGPILWSPTLALPAWWDSLNNARPIVYVTMGSSGNPSLVSTIFEALADLPLTVIAATLGQTLPRPAPANVLSASYLPGLEATARSQLVVCNGGSPTTHQALASGVPVLGIAGNMDQHLNMMGIVRQNAGALVRSDRATVATIRASASRLLDQPAFANAARRLAGSFASFDAKSRFQAVIDTI